ncbi:MAG TPA: lipase maturation factor family protein [Verrucomicrobiae bacterium]|nr:lipase maturation factor family protein [Verrucomicrobiae bacterium]
MRVAQPPAKPVMIFDSDCNFCRRWICRWQQATGDRVDYVPLQDSSIAGRFPEIPREPLKRSVHLIETDGAVYSGAEAVFRSLASAPRKRWSLWLYQRVPGVVPVTECFYRFVAGHRTAFSFLTRLFWGEHVEPPTYFLPRWVFLRLLGLIYLIAFVSLWTQVDGLIGSHGITPAAAMMQQVHDAEWASHGPALYWYLPTLCWFNTSDAFLHFLCWGGALLSLLVMVGIAVPFSLFGCWLLYLSLSVVGNIFLGYQWDALLLETGLLAVFFAPFQLVPRLSRESCPSKLGLWLLRALLFKLMFCSGGVKLSSGDPTWRNLTALRYHFETQPLPPWTAWYANQLPASVLTFCCGAMFAIELGAPFLIFFPRRVRFVGCGALVFLQVLIALTGNYCFFNLLTIALCVLLLDDGIVAAVCGQRRSRLPQAAVADCRYRVRLPWLRWFLTPFAAIYVLLSTVLIIGSFRVPLNWPAPVGALYSAVSPLRSINSYGLFAVMTAFRREIVVEGSDDGREWRAYEFKYKPGPLNRKPRFVEPFQPRLDWQMWFAALGRYQQNPWFINFCVRLLQGQPEVLALLKTNPFPAGPPRYIRAMVYDYHFTDFATRRATGQWWRRELIGSYCPVLSLKNEPTS